MARRDYLLDQINEMGAFLAKLIGLLYGKASDNQGDQLEHTAEDALLVQYGWEMEDLLFMEKTAFLAFMEENLLADDHFEQLAQVFTLLGDHALEKETLLRKELYYQKAIWLLSYLDRRSASYSMDRRDRIIQLELKMTN